MQKTRVLIIYSELYKSLGVEWFIESLDRDRFEYRFVLMNRGPSDMETFIRNQGFRLYLIQWKGWKTLPQASLKLAQIILAYRPNVVNASLLEAQVAGIPISWLLRVKKRIYTRHYSDLHHTYFPHFVKYDKVVNWMATHIVAISPVVHKILADWEHVPLSKITLIPHGFKLDQFSSVPNERTELLKSKYGLQGKGKIIGMISRFTHWKGLQYAIPAFGEIASRHPEVVFVFANASGDYTIQLDKLLEEYLKNKYIKIAFEQDVAALYSLFDIFVHVPVDPYVEAFGQVYVEALASGIPSVFTLSGIASSFVVHEQNALVVPFRNSEAIAQATERLLTDIELITKLTSNSKNVVNHFSVEKCTTAYEAFYASL